MSVNAKIAATAALVSTLKELGSSGAPGGHLYAPLMGILTLNEFERVMQLLRDRRLVTKIGQVYFWNAEEEEVA